MTIGVDARSNSLIVSAPEPLFEEVQTLVRQLDQPTGSSEAVRVVPLKRADPVALQQALSALTGGGVQTVTTPSESAGGVTGIENSNSRNRSDNYRGRSNDYRGRRGRRGRD
jgi:hypothetical protein